VLVFSSARAGTSFDFWLFRKLTPETRRLVLAFVTTSLPRWGASSCKGRDGRVRRHGPDLLELRVTCSMVGRRLLAERPARPEGPPLSVSVFFLEHAQAMILLSGAVLPACSLKSWPGTPGRVRRV
jgi:hypothetical protein